MKNFLRFSIKSLFLMLLLIPNQTFCKEKAPEPESEIKMTKEQTKQAIDQTIKLTRKQLEADSGDAKKTESLIINFVSRLEDLEVDENSWPEVSSLIKDLDAGFSQVSKDGEPATEAATQAIGKLRDFLKYGDENFQLHKEAEEKKESEPEAASQEPKSEEKDYEIEMATGQDAAVDKSETFNKKEEKEEADNFDVGSFVEKRMKDLEKVVDKETLEPEVSKLVSALSKQILTDKEGAQIAILFDDKLSPLLMKHGLEGKLVEELSDLYARLKVVWPFGQKIEIEAAPEAEKIESQSPAETSKEPEVVEKVEQAEK